MIGQLPTALEIGGIEYSINSDFRVVLNIFSAFGDLELTNEEKCYICMINLYDNFGEIPQSCIQEAVDKAYWFVGGGNTPMQENAGRAKLYDWEQDEFIIFPAINKAAGYETRAVPYLHWWSFLGLFGEIGDGLLSQVIHIRSKKSKGKPLEKWEQEFIRDNRSLIELKRKYTQEELEEREHINALLN